MAANANLIHCLQELIKLYTLTPVHIDCLQESGTELMKLYTLTHAQHSLSTREWYRADETIYVHTCAENKIVKSVCVFSTEDKGQWATEMPHGTI